MDKRINQIVKLDHDIDGEDDPKKLIDLKEQRDKLFEQLIKDKLS